MENSTIAREKHISTIATSAECMGWCAAHNGYVEHVGCLYAEKDTKGVAIHNSQMMGATTNLDMDSLYQRDHWRQMQILTKTQVVMQITTIVWTATSELELMKIVTVTAEW
jgi:hypothetical protein